MRFRLTIKYCSPVILVCLAWPQTPGYFKDIFMDGGVFLTSRLTLPAADSLGLSLEALATELVTYQTTVIIGDTNDSNGRLLYPDGLPRFRTIYTNGGLATSHGSSLGEEGRARIRQFFYNGGSYTGSCAGAFLACLSYEAIGSIPEYYHIWPGRTGRTQLLESYTGHFVPHNSPLLDYFDFGDDFYIPNIRHNGGCYARETPFYPSGTEFLLRYDYPGLPFHEKASCWAYKEDELSGRVVVIGSHPEGLTSGEGLGLMEAILLYALDGIGSTTLKAELLNAQTRVMDQATEDSLPAFTKIGDKQYHHFTIDLPQEVSSFTLSIDGEDGFDLFLYLDADTFAFEPNADYLSNQSGGNQTITIPGLAPGLWYVGVECTSTVNIAGNYYYGDLSVLNGVAYSITATWDTAGVGTETDLASVPDEYQLHQNYPNPFNPTTTIQYELPRKSNVQITIYDLLGRKMNTLVSETQDAGYKSIQWDATNDYGQPVSAGMYFYRLQADGLTQTRKMILLK